MKTNLKRMLKIGLFLVILAALNFFFARIYETVIMSSSSLVLTTDRMLEQIKKSQVEILVLGDSHPGTAIIPSHFSHNLISWTSAGEKYHHNYYKLKYFLTHCQRPKVVILPLDIPSFSSNFSPEKDDFYWVKYMDYFEFGKKKNRTSKFIRKYVKGLFFPYAGESATLYQWLLKDYIDVTKAGFAPSRVQGLDRKKNKFKKIAYTAQSNSSDAQPYFNDAGAKERQNAAETRVLNQFYKRNFFDPLKVEYFNKILTLCRQANIQLLLVKFPVTLEYYRYVSQHLFSPESYYQKIESIIPKNYIGYHILDYQDIFFDKPGLMKDPDHVNFDGAAIISKRINKKIKKILNFPVVMKKNKITITK
jgi:hypothetical protein